MESKTNIAAKYPWLSFCIVLAVIDFPQWFQSVWSLFSTNAPVPELVKYWKRNHMPMFSPYWITIPLGILMFVYLFYEVKKASKAPTISLRSSHLMSLENLGDDEKPIQICDFRTHNGLKIGSFGTNIITPQIEYYKKRMATGSVELCVITNHSDIPLISVKIPIIINLYRPEDGNVDDRKPIKQYEIMTSNTLIPVLKQKESVAFLIGNESEHLVEFIFTGYLNAKVGNSQEAVDIRYTFETTFSQAKLVGPGMKEFIARERNHV